MENFVNMGKEYLSGQQGQQGGGSLFNLQNVIGHATEHDQQQGAQANSGLFATVANTLHQKQASGNMDQNVDEGMLKNIFNKVSGTGTGTDEEVGQASAVDAFRKHLTGGNQNQASLDSILGKAMSQAGAAAAKSGGNQQNAMDHASQTVMKLAMKHKLNSMMGKSDYSEIMSLLT
ncbi:hypothetical protein MVES1_000290 [Malassezia vespertilionis]|uniref:DUF7721 domain-containing protein n=1 Tax=Malassezia vespertilionis TaxID=2020962 RepID=A0A2N1JGJ9_9BASI|nr:uncharacterized protein MVES1_000290 [Malassezia vespertilionis]PKI85658.1 hypothetical protein MVES_000272 [Malassezia vespertilionis]WFD04965.1 hypothetical protein MVES1_000290 [Malassezia vespertilionis]